MVILLLIFYHNRLKKSRLFKKITSVRGFQRGNAFGRGSGTESPFFFWQFCPNRKKYFVQNAEKETPPIDFLCKMIYNTEYAIR